LVGGEEGGFWKKKKTDQIGERPRSSGQRPSQKTIRKTFWIGEFHAERDPLLGE